MPLLFPTQGTLNDSFSPLPFGRTPEPDEPQSSHRSRQDRYPAWSTAEDVKSKAGALSEEAQTELKKAGQTVQAKTGKIELYSGKYYSTCILGGLIACVCHVMQLNRVGWLTTESGCHSYRCHTVRPCQMPTPGRFEDVQGQF